MAEEAVLTEEEQAAAETKAAEDKAAEEQATKEAEEAAAAAEESSLEKREEEIRQQEEDAAKEEKEAADTDVEDLDWDKLKEDHPEIEKLGIKDMAELVQRYFGGLEGFQKNSEIVSKLKELGVETREEREELFKKLGAKEDIKPPEKGEETTEKTFADTRRESLARFIPKEVIDPETEEPRALTDEEKKSRLDYAVQYADSIVPSHIPDTVDRVEAEATNLRDDLTWALFQLQPILEEHKDKLIPNSVRAEILEHSKKFPKTYAEIVQDALKRGVNFYGPVHHHFLRNTKKDLIEAEQKKRWEAERDKEDKKKKDAKTETTKKAVPSGTSKSLSEMSFAEREQAIRDQENAG